ncbi:MAG: COX15/CtaA family protein [bacterium]
MSNSAYVRLSLIAAVLAFCLIVLGAYVRLSNAGLGCPDWPGCYGHYAVPAAEKAFQSHPDSPLVPHKAWKEMIHRYVAGTLGLLILSLAVFSVLRRRDPRQSVFLPWLLVLIVIFQALLGRWTVTLKLHPLVVMGHLLGGLATFGLLVAMTLRQGGFGSSQEFEPAAGKLKPYLVVGWGLLLLQIALGGWTSANYASLACPDFPRCQGHWLPPFDFGEAFTLWRQSGANYEGGVLDNAARITIHMMHRLGAVVVFLYLGRLVSKITRSGGTKAFRRLGMMMGLLLVFQIALGISNVVFRLPLPVAVAHNAGAALLFFTLTALWCGVLPARKT